MPGEWPFEDELRVAVFTTSHVIRNGKPILRVSRDADDGTWQFHDGGPVFMKDAMIVALEEVLEIDPTISALANLPRGYCARQRLGASRKRRLKIEAAIQPAPGADSP